jgi:acyl-CoA reductase-like NAD-dependent aldehyde dehydrogenase
MMFTGSTKTGRTVASQAAEHLIPSSMELGGKNAMLVLEDADLDRTVEGAERALFSNAGQLCISIERLYVHETLADEFTRRLVERTKAMRLGASLGFDDDMGSLISQDQLDTVREHVDDAVAKGATVLTGGRARPDLGPYFHEPTLLADVREGMTLFADETFGPVASISRFSDEDEAVERANASDFGLNFSIWSRDTARGRRLATRLKAGTVNVNEGFIAAWGSVDAPMGGMKDSGLAVATAGRILKYTEAQTVRAAAAADLRAGIVGGPVEPAHHHRPAAAAPDPRRPASAPRRAWSRFPAHRSGWSRRCSRPGPRPASSPWSRADGYQARSAAGGIDSERIEVVPATSPGRLGLDRRPTTGSRRT